MNHPDFTQIRRLIDQAITFNDLPRARALAREGLCRAQEREILGEELFFRAQLEIVDGRFAAAIPYLDQAIQFNPTDGAAFNDRALCMIETGVIAGALEYFDQGIAVEPDYETVYHNKGWFLNKLGQHQAALVLLQKALELAPDRAVTYENIADVYENLGRPQEAAAFYKKALNLVEPEFDDIRAQLRLKIERLGGEG